MRNITASRMIILSALLLLICLGMMGEAYAELVIPYGVTVIEEEAFYGDISVTSVILPDTVESIGDRAFAGTHLTHIRLSSGLSYISPTAFEGIEYLEAETETDTWADIWWEDNKSAFGYEANTPEDYFQFTEKADGTAQIDYYNGSGNITKVIIPKYLGGKKVTVIGKEAFKNCSSLTGVIISDGIHSIGNEAFYGCSSLASIILPGSVTSITNNGEIQALLSDDGIFQGCEALKTAGPIGGGYNIEFGWTDSIPYQAFQNCTSLTAITIPDGVQTISDMAFYGCSSLTKINIPASVSVFGENAFTGCSGMQEIYIDNLESWLSIKCSFMGIFDLFDEEEYVQYCGPNCASSDCRLFIGNEEVNCLTIPSGITNIGKNKLSNFINLTDIIIPDSVTSIEDQAFAGTGLTHIRLSSGLTYISPTSFLGITYLDAETETDTWADIWWEDNKGSFGHEANTPAESFQYSELENGTIRIDKYIGSLTISSVIIPKYIKNKKVTAIGTDCFFINSIPSRPVYLRSIYIPDSVISIGNRAFYILVSDDDGIPAHGNSDYQAIKNLYVSDANTAYVSENGVLFNKTKTELICYLERESNTAYTIPETVTTIRDFAFYRCRSLTSITIPDGVTVIGNNAFESCNSLVSIAIPNSVINIGEEAFKNCSKLSDVNIPNSLTNIENGTFFGCNGLTSFIIPDGVISVGNSAFQGCQNLTSLSISDGVTSIGSSAFEGCLLYNIKLPDALTEIGSRAFYGNTDLIISHYFPSSLQSIGSEAFYSCTDLGRDILIIPDDTIIAQDAFEGCGHVDIQRYTFHFENLYMIVSENVMPGKTVNIVLNYLDVSNTVQYRYEVWQDDILVGVRDWATDALGNIEIDNEGEYTIKGYLKIGKYCVELGSSDTHAGYTPVQFTVYPSTLCAITGKKIVFFTNCSGGSGKYEYKFELYHNNEFVNTTEWSQYNSASAYLYDEGTYKLLAWAHDTITDETVAAETDTIIISDSLQITEQTILETKEEARKYLNNSCKQLITNINHSFAIYYLQAYEENLNLRISSGIYKGLTDPMGTLLSGPDKSELYEALVRDYLNVNRPNYHKPVDIEDNINQIVSAVQDEYEFLTTSKFGVGPGIFDGFIVALQMWANLKEEWAEIDLLLQNTQYNLDRLAQLREVYSSSQDMVNAIDKIGGKIVSEFLRNLEALKDSTSYVKQWVMQVGYDAGVVFSVNEIEAVFGVQALSPALFTGIAWNLIDKVYNVFSNGNSISQYIDDNRTLIAKCEIMLDLQDAFAAIATQGNWGNAMIAVEPYYQSAKNMYEFFRDMSWNHYEATVIDDINQLENDYQQFVNILNAYNAFQ